MHFKNLEPSQHGGSKKNVCLGREESLEFKNKSQNSTAADPFGPCVYTDAFDSCACHGNGHQGDISRNHYRP